MSESVQVNEIGVGFQTSYVSAGDAKTDDAESIAMKQGSLRLTVNSKVFPVSVPPGVRHLVVTV